MRCDVSFWRSGGAATGCQSSQRLLTVRDGQEMIVHLSIDVDFDVDILVHPALRPSALIPKGNFSFDASSSQFVIHRLGHRYSVGNHWPLFVSCFNKYQGH